MQPRLEEPLIRTYGAFRVRQLILEMEGRKPRTLDVCRLTMANTDGEETPLTTIPNERINLPWVVYTIEECLKRVGGRINIIESLLSEHSQANEEAAISSPVRDIPKDERLRLITGGPITANPIQLKIMREHYPQLSEALSHLRATYPGEIEDVSEIVRAVFGRLSRLMQEGSLSAHAQFDRESQIRAGYGHVLGNLVLRTGPFHVYEIFGAYTPTGSLLIPLQQRKDGTWIPSVFAVRYEDEPLISLDVGALERLEPPGIVQVCETVGRWLTVTSDSIASANAMFDRKAAADRSQGTSMAWREREYEIVRNAWAALGCIDEERK
jgi:hypothetical protein